MSEYDLLFSQIDTDKLLKLKHKIDNEINNRNFKAACNIRMRKECDSSGNVLMFFINLQDVNAFIVNTLGAYGEITQIIGQNPGLFLIFYRDEKDIDNVLTDKVKVIEKIKKYYRRKAKSNK